jgi:hypothetical protein
VALDEEVLKPYKAKTDAANAKLGEHTRLIGTLLPQCLKQLFL